MSDPKLMSARDRIKAILDELDIAAYVVMHNAPGKFEILTKLDPSYSKLIGLPPVMRLCSKLDDYEGNSEAQRRDLQATANMVSGLGASLGVNALQLMELAAWVDARIGAEHGPMEPDPDPDLAHDTER